ncbi:CPBP family intramembrane glutamic endopeptidase [Sphingorhabdus sp.]|jgi:membrane protease YdiL (CAAX protease family)|uniref:CPBP family intramembrane glutamic endopeptidase n=1 Tax=Sphingorhabdus sp. TaxID=1902408 RepID=UPI003BB016A6|nr:CPBP family intramembrane metalloprotease [Sphingomonadales bacterium]MBK9432848.1 CPBP family intramembrane metalloprotease [Sphingomonadales bacterium]MBL0021428.1 CPBP family intramembrane metalloprotease [Sphingomonadales bacterium]
MRNILKRIVTHPAFLLVVGFVIITFAMVWPQAAGQALAPLPGRTDWVDLGISIAAAASTILAYWIFTHLIERKASQDLALKGAGREWGLGAALGFGAMVATISVIWLFGGYHVTGHNGASVLVGVASMAIVSGITEEILLRGVVFRLLEQWLGSIAALALSAALFGAMHLGNPNASWLAAFAIAIEAGIMLGAIYMLTRRLWAAIGLHMAWNATQGGLFGVSVSGTDVAGLLTSKSSGSPLLTGGAFGAEASLPAMIICTTLGLWILLLAYRKGSFVRASWQRFKSGADTRTA